MSEARVVQVIATTSYTGDGTEKSPGRLVHELYTLDGHLLACRDQHTGESFATEQLAAL